MEADELLHLAVGRLEAQHLVACPKFDFEEDCVAGFLVLLLEVVVCSELL
jgi:hypothetical protein